MVRPLVGFLLTVLLSGCAASKAASAPQPKPEEAPRARGSAAARPIWGVRSFDERAGWLAAQPALTEGEWGERMAIAVQHALDERRVDARVLPQDVTPAQMTELYEKGLQYLCEGTLSAVATADGTTSLTVSYRLKRRLGEDTRTVQARVIQASAPAAALDEAALSALVTAAAGQIADAVIADVPADLLAIRG